MIEKYARFWSLFKRFWWLPFPLAMLGWANWNAPEMHHYVRPANTAVWQLAPLADAAVARRLEARLGTEPGVSACAVSTRTGCVAIVYHPNEATPAALYQALGRFGVQVVSRPLVQPVAPAVRQCPIPPGYGLVIDQIRFALNLRRLFVRV